MQISEMQDFMENYRKNNNTLQHFHSMTMEGGNESEDTDNYFIAMA